MAVKQPIDSRAPRKSYLIAFDTSSTDGAIRAVKVTLEPEMIMPDDEKHAINLIDHPLYSYLRQYVLSNLKNTR